MRLRCRLFVLMAAAAACAAAGAQGVNKCERDGKVVYQSTPCTAGRASTVKIEAGPSDEDVAAARQRAEKDKNAADLAVATAAAKNAARAAAQTPAGPMLRGGGGSDCASLAARYAQASNRRNMALGSARRGAGVTAGSAEDNSIAMRQMEVADLAAAMRARGCGG